MPSESMYYSPVLKQRKYNRDQPYGSDSVLNYNSVQQVADKVMAQIVQT